MSIEQRALRALVAISSALALGGCGDDLAPAWEIRGFRLFGAKIENVTRQPTDPGVTEAAPGEQVRLTLSYVDPATGATVSRHWPMDSVERWTPGAREFVRVATLERAHYGLSARQLGGGSLLVSGGTGDYGELWGAGSELVRLQGAFDLGEDGRREAVAGYGHDGVQVVGTGAQLAALGRGKLGHCKSLDG